MGKGKIILVHWSHETVLDVGKNEKEDRTFVRNVYKYTINFSVGWVLKSRITAIII